MMTTFSTRSHNDEILTCGLYRVGQNIISLVSDIFHRKWSIINFVQNLVQNYSNVFYAKAMSSTYLKKQPAKLIPT